MTLVVTTIGVAPAMAVAPSVALPAVDAAMPGFAALLASAGPAPAVTTEMARPQVQAQAQPLATGASHVPSILLVPDVAGRVNMAAPSAAGGLLAPKPSPTPPAFSSTPSSMLTSMPDVPALSAAVDAQVPAMLPEAEAANRAPATLASVIAPAPPLASTPSSRRPTATDCRPVAAAAPPIETRDDDPGAPDAAAIATAPPVLVSVLVQAPPPSAPPGTGPVPAAETVPPAGPLLPMLDGKVSTPPPPPTVRDVAGVRPPSRNVPSPVMPTLAVPGTVPAAAPVERAVSFSIAAMVSMPTIVPGTSMPQPAASAVAVVASAPSLAVSVSALPSAPAAAAALPGAAPLRAAPVLRDPRLPRSEPERDRSPGPAALAGPTPLRVALRVETLEPAPSVAAFDAQPATGADIGIRSDRLGAVRIGIDGAAGDLRVSLGLSPAAAAIVAADAPRLIADLAANGVRLQSLDVSGGFTGGQAPPQGQQQPQAQAQTMPRAGVPAAALNPIITARASTADRYA